MIPVEIQKNSPRFQSFIVEESNEERKVNLYVMDKVREEARIKAEALKRRVEYKYNSKLRPRQFQVVDLVMRKAHPYQLKNKLSPKWTGPFKVTESPWEWSIQARDVRRRGDSSYLERDQQVLF